jgi:hypothetical protein
MGPHDGIDGLYTTEKAERELSWIVDHPWVIRLADVVEGFVGHRLHGK